MTSDPHRHPVPRVAGDLPGQLALRADVGRQLATAAGSGPGRRRLMLLQRVARRSPAAGPSRVGVSPNANESATSANFRQSGEPLASNTSSFTYGSSAAYSASSRAENVLPCPRQRRRPGREFHISGTATSWPRSSRPIGAGFQMSVGLARQQRRPARPGRRAGHGRRPTACACGGEVGSRWMNTCDSVTSSPDAILALRLDRVVQALAVRQVHQHPGALAVAAHRRAERDLLARLVRVAQPGRVVGAQHDVRVQHPEPRRRPWPG